VKYTMGKKKPKDVQNLICSLYLDKKIPMSKVSAILGVNRKTVRKYLSKAGVKIRPHTSYSVHKRIVFNAQQYQFFDGLVVSDGCLYEKYDRNNAKITSYSVHEEFARYMKDYLCMVGLSMVKNKQSVGYSVWSENNILFTEERKRWYINGTKIVPHDFRYSPLSMKIWYICDGTIRKNKILLCTDSFGKKNLETTVVPFLRTIGVKSWVTKNNRVYISAISSRRFLDYIGECPVDCFRYKWNLIPPHYYKPTAAELHDMYILKKMPISEIGSKLGLSEGTILNKLRLFNIPTRCLHDAQILNWKKRRQL